MKRMKEDIVFCPQCGRESPEFQYEKGDCTGGDPVQTRPWACPECGYPDVIAIKELKN